MDLNKAYNLHGKLTLHQVQAWLEGTVYDSKPAYKFLKYYLDIKIAAT
jgi:hypothetical protein